MLTCSLKGPSELTPPPFFIKIVLQHLSTTPPKPHQLDPLVVPYFLFSLQASPQSPSPFSSLLLEFPCFLLPSPSAWENLGPFSPARQNRLGSFPRRQCPEWESYHLKTTSGKPWQMDERLTQTRVSSESKAFWIPTQALVRLGRKAGN